MPKDKIFDMSMVASKTQPLDPIDPPKTDPTKEGGNGDGTDDGNSDGTSPIDPYDNPDYEKKKEERARMDQIDT